MQAVVARSGAVDVVDQLEVPWGEAMSVFISQPAKHMVVATTNSNAIGVWHVDLEVRSVPPLMSAACVCVCQGG